IDLDVEGQVAVEEQGRGALGAAGRAEGPGRGGDVLNVEAPERGEGVGRCGRAALQDAAADLDEGRLTGRVAAPLALDPVTTVAALPAPPQGAGLGLAIVAGAEAEVDELLGHGEA